MTAPAEPEDDVLLHLHEQRDFLLRSLEDLEREHEAGDLDDEDYEALKDDYTARAAAAIRAIDAHRAVDTTVDRAGNGRRTALILVGIAAFALVAGIAVASSLGARKPGETSSGGIQVEQTASQRANACIPKMQTAPPAESIECFKAVIDDDPQNAVALTWLGWDLSLHAPEGEPGQLLQATAGKLLDRAVKADPDYSYARAFRAVIAYRQGDAAAARRYLREFEANDPAADARQIIQQMDLKANIEALAKEQAQGGGAGSPGGAASPGGSGSTPSTTAPSIFATTTTTPG